MEPKHILFLDYDQQVLEGLQRVFRPMRKVWDMQFTPSPQEALALLKTQPIDLVLADLTHDESDGLAFLEQVSRRYPDVVRIVFASHVSEQQAMQALKSTHQVLLKPIDAEDLKQRITRLFCLRDLLEDADLKKLIGQLRSIPSLPYFYREIMAELKKPEASIKAVGDIIAQDMAMSAKILQLVNSPFFGFYKHIASPAQAVMLLGLDTVRNLTLTLHLFACFEERKMPVISYPRLWEHSMQTASLAKQIVMMETEDAEMADQAFIAGLLHDVGKLILAVDFPELYLSFHRKSVERDIDMIALEQQTFHATHAQVGAYLLGLWGLPDPIVEAVAFHHNPLAAHLSAFAPLVAVHVANWKRNRCEPNFLGTLPPLDMPLLKSLKLAKHLQRWEALERS